MSDPLEIKHKFIRDDSKPLHSGSNTDTHRNDHSYWSEETPDEIVIRAQPTPKYGHTHTEKMKT